MTDITFRSLSKTDDRNQALTILQGTDCTLEIAPLDVNSIPVPTTGYSLAGQFKSDYDARTVVLSFTQSDSSIVNDTAQNRFLVHFTAAGTSAVKFKGDSLEGVYDFELTYPDGSKTKALYGTFTLLREVTA
jgi:hypothetical protein